MKFSSINLDEEISNLESLKVLSHCHKNWKECHTVYTNLFWIPNVENVELPWPLNTKGKEP